MKLLEELKQTDSTTYKQFLQTFAHENQLDDEKDDDPEKDKRTEESKHEEEDEKNDLIQM